MTEIDYSTWATVVASDDRTPIWSGPREDAQAWIDSPLGQSAARALAHRGAGLVVGECYFGKDE